ncbi:MAG: hypothetical protein ACXVCP_09750 [Bdellovibrio sp.]
MNHDSTKKKLLIIKSNPTSLGSVESFLRNREWHIKSTSNLKEALIFLVQEKPQFVMVGIDHPNSKVRNLPKILVQALQVCLIAFTEDTSTKAYELLNNCKTDYLLYPPVTGPAVERTVNKYYKDQQTKNQKTSPAGMTKAELGNDGIISIKGDSTSLTTQNAQSILQQLMRGEDPPAFLQGDDSAASEELNSPIERTSKSASLYGVGPSWIPQREGKTTSDNSDATIGFPDKPSNPGWAPQGIGAGASHKSGVNSDKNSHSHNYQNRKKSDNSRLTPEELLNNPLSSKKDSVVLRGTKNALENSCTATPFADSEALESSSNIACIMLESLRVSGYLVAAMGKNRRIDETLIKKIQERLFNYLKDNGETFSENEFMNLRLQSVPFEKWSLEQAEFLRKSVHDGQEIAMAFFPRVDIRASHEKSAAKEMIAIKMEELEGDIAVDFNLYIYLQQNEKYILYTPRGSTFHSIQKERLQNQGVTNLHILKMEIQDLDKYRAQNFLNEKIANFENSKKEKDIA